MSYKIILSDNFEKKLQKLSNKNQIDKLKQTIITISTDPFDKSLNTHKLKGKLKDFYSIKCGYDCRIIFSIEYESEEVYLLLIDFGTHNQVYQN